MSAIAANRFLAPAFADQVGFQITLPSLLEANGCCGSFPVCFGLFGVCFLPRLRVLSFADLSETH
ncbi:hypothetical protein [Bradyrhizobium sp. Cp5.3]|uniref:hypothetical protein n=1 Tax=Bradyrhizobium sp. Cp5.3 TaxID=443598 RepID=UPI0012EB261A|nr:hypothetical protein [Bradyrhizobium sp. Cp5.3]